MINKDKKIRVLILIDCQRDFIYGSLANEEAQKKVPNIVKKVREFDGDAIFLTMDTHDDNYLDTPEGKKLPVKHCIYGTDGWKINPEIEHAVEEKEKEGIKVRYIKKPTFGSVEGVHTDGDMFRNPSLIDEVFMLESGIKEPIPMEIEIGGFCTDICVCSNALILKAFTYDFAEITVDANCCAGVTPEKHEAALEVMRSCQINVIEEKE